MTAQTLIAELNQRGISIAVRDNQILSRPAIPTDLMPALREHKAAIIAELKDQQDSDNTDLLKQTFGATELTGAKHLKSQYNYCLARFRDIAARLDDKKLPPSEGLMAEAVSLQQELGRLLDSIGKRTRQETAEGFRI